MYSCCCLKHGYSNLIGCRNLHYVQLVFISVQRTAQTSFRIFLQTRIEVDGAKFNSHDSGGQFLKVDLTQKCRCKKNSHIFVIKLKLQVRFSMQSLHIYTHF